MNLRRGSRQDARAHADFAVWCAVPIICMAYLLWLGRKLPQILRQLPRMPLPRSPPGCRVDAEAMDRQNMRFVPIKTDDQLDLQALHRVRDRLITRRTSVINQLRAFLLERGLVFAKSPAKLRERMPEILENAEEDLTPRMRNLLALLWSEWKDHHGQENQISTNRPDTLTQTSSSTTFPLQ